MNGRSIVRSAVAKLLRPVLGTLDRRIEVLAARLERHTERLSLDQRAEIHRIDDRLTLDVAVLSEHLVGIDRVARRVEHAASSSAVAPVMPGRFVLALPGEALRLPDGCEPRDVMAFVADGSGVWSPASGGDESTLRVVALPARATT